MATISSLVINSVLPSHDRPDEAETPTTPRAFRFPAPTTPESPSKPSIQQINQREANLESTASSSDEPQLQSSQSAFSITRSLSKDDNSDAMDIDNSDDEQQDSDNEADGGDADGDGSGRTKKGQRFFCTGYPPCNLSFTRSEHLARHIRKHTGERPFQCHCNRRFSRLDNLRQHAQTVHVNEEIPNDSLAATGTCFQRQIRTDRVRPTGRPRSGTMGSTGSHGRGHSRNLSASSVVSTSSSYSTVTEAKRRPPPLLMANDMGHRPKLSLEAPNTPPTHYHNYGPHSPGGMTTPTSATFSHAPGSPGFGSTTDSPTASSVRSVAFYPQSPRTHARRLSVPSGTNQYPPPHPNSYPPQYGGAVGQPGMNSSHSSMFSSPTSANFTFVPGHHHSVSEDWRRRTWHPSTYSNVNFNYGRPATSGLTYSQTPDAPQPAYAQYATAAAGHAPRLPGIESFDHVQHRPTTPPRRQPSPMHIESGQQQPYPVDNGPRQSIHSGVEERGQSGRPLSWGQQTIQEIQNVGAQQKDMYRSSDMGPPPPSAYPPSQQQPQHIAQEALRMQASGNKNKRYGWYQGPVPTRTSPEDSSSSEGVPTPGTASADIHPIIMNGGYVDPQHHLVPSDSQQNACIPTPSHVTSIYVNPDGRQRAPSFGERSSTSGDMNRLEALVAVATSGDNAASGGR